MYQVSVNKRDKDALYGWDVSAENGRVFFPGHEEIYSCEELPGRGFSILYNGKSFRAYVQEVDRERKTVKVRVNDSPFLVTIREPVDKILEQMGYRQQEAHRAKDLKAPMPGLVLKIMVVPGQAISKGDPLLVLEAMKMENVFKADSDAVVKEIKVQEKQPVEKGQVLLVLE